MTDFKKGAEFVRDFTKDVIDKVGPRLPGSEEERKASPIIADFMEKATGNKSKIESFKLSPMASIGSIPALGVIGFIILASFYVHPIIALILSAGTLLFAILQIFMYTGALDFLFKKSTSNNVYSVLEPKSGKVDRTIIYSGHNDSSWNWNLSIKNPKTVIIKIVLGVVGFVFMIVISLIATINEYNVWSGNKSVWNIIFQILPLFTLITSYWLTVFMSWDKKKAAPGAMDNLSGVGLSILMAKHYRENPTLFPENTRIICAGVGAEEAGLKGSTAFMKAHKDDKDLLINPYFVNLDSFRDYDHFNVVKGDLWLFSRFDKDMIQIGMDTFNELGLNPHIIVNPVGGCDSTPIKRCGFKTVTLNAQNPTATDYYHTYKDTTENLDMRTLEKSFEALTIYTDKLVEFDKKSNSSK